MDVPADAGVDVPVDATADVPADATADAGMSVDTSYYYARALKFQEHLFHNYQHNNTTAQYTIKNFTTFDPANGLLGYITLWRQLKNLLDSNNVVGVDTEFVPHINPWKQRLCYIQIGGFQTDRNLMMNFWPCSNPKPERAEQR